MKQKRKHGILIPRKITTHLIHNFGTPVFSHHLNTTLVHDNVLKGTEYWTCTNAKCVLYSWQYNIVSNGWSCYIGLFYFDKKSCIYKNSLDNARTSRYTDSYIVSCTWRKILCKLNGYNRNEYRETSFFGAGGKDGRRVRFANITAICEPTA
jgi:hypothetical protein